MPSEVSPDTLEIILEVTNELVASRAKAVSASLSDLINSMRLSGMSNEAIRKKLIDDLQGEGRIFGQIKNNFVNVTNQSIELSSNYASRDIYRQKRSDSMTYEWTLDPRIQNHCEDCIDRSQREPKTLEEWELLGLPASGVTICGTNCGCKLTPKGTIKSLETAA